MIYQIVDAVFEYKTLLLTEACRIKLAERVKEAHNLELPPTASLIFKNLEAEWHDQPERAEPDITKLEGYLVFSPKAMLALSKLIPARAEIIPFTLDNERWSVIDLVKSSENLIESISDEGQLTSQSYEEDPDAYIQFQEDAVVDELFFLENPDLRYFCQNKFKEAVEAVTRNDLKGIVITENLVTLDYRLVDPA